MAKGNRYQITGTEEKLSQNPAHPSPSANPKSGTFELMGTTVSLGRNSIQSPSANPKSGEFQIIGDTQSMSRAAVKGWGNAASLTMSPRAIEQSKTAAGGGSKRKR